MWETSTRNIVLMYWRNSILLTNIGLVRNIVDSILTRTTHSREFTCQYLVTAYVAKIQHTTPEGDDLKLLPEDKLSTHRLTGTCQYYIWKGNVFHHAHNLWCRSIRADDTSRRNSEENTAVAWFHCFLPQYNPHVHSQYHDAKCTHQCIQPNWTQSQNQGRWLFLCQTMKRTQLIMGLC